MMGVTLKIKEVEVKIQTRPSVRPDWSPLLEMNIVDITAQSTNSAWQPVDLAKTKETDPSDASVTKLFKLITAKSITLTLRGPNDPNTSTPKILTLLDKLPIRFQFTSRWNLKESDWIGGALEIILDELSLRLTLEEFQLLKDFGQSIRNAFARPVPERPAKLALPDGAKNSAPNTPTTVPSVPKGGKPKAPVAISSKLKLPQWMFEFSNGLTGSELQGYRMQGSGIQLEYSQGNRLTPGIDLWETVLFAAMGNVQLTQLNPSPSGSPILLFQNTEIPMDLFSARTAWKMEHNPAYNPNELPREGETPTPQYLVKEMTINGNMVGMQAEWDVEGWYQLVRMFRPDLIESIKEQALQIDEIDDTLTHSDTEENQVENQVEKSEDDEKKKEKMERRKRMKEKLKQNLEKRLASIQDWNDIKVHLEIQDTTVVVPDYVGDDASTVTGMTLQIQKLAFFSHPIWDDIPLLENSNPFNSPPKYQLSTSTSTSTSNLPPKLPPKSVPNLPPKVPSKEAPALPPKVAPTLPPKVPTAAPTVPTSSQAPAVPPKVPILPPKVKTAVSDRISKNVAYRSETHVSGVSLKLNASTEPVFSSANTKLFTRYTIDPPVELGENSEKTREKSHRFLEGSEMKCVLHMGNLQVDISDEQLAYLYQLVNSRVEWGKAVARGNEHAVNHWRDRIQKKLSTQVHATLGENLASFDAMHTLQAKVENSFENYRLSVFIRADKGQATLPTGTLVNLDEAQKVATGSVVASKGILPCKVRFTGMELGFQNTGKKQAALLRLKTAAVDELDHPESPVIVSLLPFHSISTSTFNINTENSRNLEIFFSRTPRENQPSLSEVFLRLQELQIMVQKKKPVEGKAESGIPKFSVENLEAMIHKIVGKFEENREDLKAKFEKLKTKASEENVVENLRNIHFDLEWDVEMGDCEINYKDGPEPKIKNSFRLCNSDHAHKISQVFFNLNST
eukprot:TRINITY_DN970_c0_g1_i2.p1 TRINITY_DN970_c0_g1~~TRINITY_DN970_c0_g1_i2.p1  ORF type:complete len:1084 (+),score=441.48 TRINITY_DN970_c0_g1_i2:366-3254(+)